MNKKKIAAIDAMALAYKAYFAFISRPLRNSKGENTSAVYGFLAQLIRVIEDIRPDYLVVAFDSKEKTFRHEMYDKYKSSRAVMPDDMIPQIQRIKDIVNALEIPLLIKSGYEADDLIGSLLKKTSSDGVLSYAVTPDKDYIQLLNEYTLILRPGKANEEPEIIDLKKAEELYGFSPAYMVDYLAIAGDSSDDIPGVSGIGPKGAVPLLNEFGTLENIYSNIDKIQKEGIRKKLIESKDAAFLSKKLAAIVTDMKLDFDYEKAKFELKHPERLIELLRELELKSLETKFSKLLDFESAEIPNQPIGNDISGNTSTEKKYILITTTSEAEKLAKKLSDVSEFVFDTETDSLDLRNLNLAGASFSIREDEAWFIAINPAVPLGGLFSDIKRDGIEASDFVSAFKPVFENPAIKKICQNAKYDLAVLRNYGIECRNIYFDTMLASYLLDPDQKHGMDDLSLKYLNYQPVSYSELTEKSKDPDIIFKVDLDKLSFYACEDADITLKLYNLLKPLLEKEKLEKLAYEIEFPLVRVLEDMERTGVRIDTGMLNSLSRDLQILIDNYSAKIFELGGGMFNINSPIQLQEILFDKLGLKGTKKTKTGFSTDARSLENLKGEHEIIDILLDYRQAAKLKSTYADALPKLINPATGKIHTTYNQAAVSTGRLSSINPNLQNIPIRTEMGKEIRKAFIPSTGNHLILSADYSQIELRIMASICGDENLIQAFLNGEDIHRSTAAKVFGVSSGDVTSDMRRKAKEVNFGILYGIGAFGLKTRLGITQQHAKEVIDTYFKTFRKVRDFMDSSIESAREKGYAETLTGRRRYLPNINSKNNAVKQFEERVAINMPIQGTAADMIKAAMISVFNYLEKNKMKTKMVLQVHDELVFDVPKEEADDVKEKIKELMENAFPLNVPVIAESGIGDNWLEAH